MNDITGKVLSTIYKTFGYLTIRQQSRVVYERIVNEAKLS